MARFKARACNCEDYPCCGCDCIEVSTGQEAIDDYNEDQQRQYEEDLALDDEDDVEVDDFDDHLTDYEADTPLGQMYADGFEPD